MLVACDFHNHSCLSPCASLDMSPSLIARLAAARGLELVALTDHNAALNAPAFADSARREGLAALYGMEACSLEEVHVLCLFAEPGAAIDFGAFLAVHLPAIPLESGAMGDQVVVDADEIVLDQVGTWLGAALDLGFGELCAEADSAGALVIPAHIDRPLFGAISQLGFLPDGPYAAVETVRPIGPADSRGYPVITGSDAHWPEHLARRPFGLELEPGWRRGDGSVDLGALRKALSGGRIRLPFGR